MIELQIERGNDDASLFIDRLFAVEKVYKGIVALFPNSGNPSFALPPADQLISSWDGASGKIRDHVVRSGSELSHVAQECAAAIMRAREAGQGTLGPAAGILAQEIEASLKLICRQLGLQPR